MSIPSPEDLAQIEAIKQLKYAYLRCLDQKDWEGIARLFTEDATAAYSGGAYTAEGRDGIVSFLSRNMGHESFHSSHRVHHPEIGISGDTATARWALEDTVVDPDMGYLLMGAAFYEDTCVRAGDEWLIATTSYRRTFEFVVPLTDLPHFSLTASWWRTGGASMLPVQ